MRSLLLSAISSSVLLVLLFAATQPAARGEDLDSAMYRLPEIPVPSIVKTYPGGIPELWLAALGRPERDLRTSAAQAIASAHSRGMPGLKVAIGPLTRLIEEENQHPAVLVAAARALVVLDARDAAPALLSLAKSGSPELREIVEPSLARWDHAPARDFWIERLNQPPPHTRAAITAARWLGVVRAERAIPRLKELALSDEVDGPYRLEAARALAEMRAAGLTPDAARLSGDQSQGGRTARLVAASLLRHSEGDEVVRLLQGLARDSEPAVARTALARLIEIDTRHILPVLEPVLASPDGPVRLFGVEALFHHPSTENIGTLSGRLSDPHPDVRIRARRALVDLAAKWKNDVIEGGVRNLAAKDWRGQEQAAILLGTLDHKPASAGLVELLQSTRSEVLVAVGWALRKLEVPDTLPPILDHVRRRHSEQLRSGPSAGVRGVSARAMDLHLSHLIQFLGQARFKPASPVLIAIVPRFLKRGMPPVMTPVGPEARSATIWSLGLIHEGNPEKRLVSLIEERLTGDPGMGPDEPPVRRMAAVSLARLKAKQSLEALRLHASGTQPDADIVVNACRWALGQLTGEPVPPPGVIEVRQKNWFLIPLK